MTKPQHPLLPDEARTALTIVTFMFGSTGVFLAVVALIGLLGGSGKADGIPGWVYVIMLAIAGGYLWIARLLSKRRKLGGVLGIVILGLSVLSRLGAGGVTIFDIALPMLGAIGLAFSWSYLDDGKGDGEDPERPQPFKRMRGWNQH